jgi:hypothetical protein
MFANFLLLADERNRPPVGEGVKGDTLKRMAQVWNALDKLDGEYCTILITAEGPPAADADAPYSGKAIEVAGGKDNQYVCTAYIKDEFTPTYAINPGVPVAKTFDVLLKRGELESFPKHLVLGKSDVAAALTAFVTEGKLTDELIWEDAF